MGLDTNDTIRGTGGNDVIIGGGGDDFLLGHDDVGRDPIAIHLANLADTLVGAAGDDTLFGGGGADYLVGAGQIDHLRGGAGADVLVGDWLAPDEFGAHTGGQMRGADVFGFQRVYGVCTPPGTPGDTGFGPERDTVRDFRQEEDKLDLTGWENPASYGGSFIGQDAFSAGPYLQVRYRHEGDDRVVHFRAPVGFREPVEEGEIVLSGRFDLAASDFAFSSLQPAPGGTPEPTPAPPQPAKSFADAHQAQAARLYDAIFYRIPDPGGLEYWHGVLRAGTPLQAVGDGLMEAPEFQTRYGTPDHQAFVALLYQNVLDRPAEPGGMSYWTGLLAVDGSLRDEIVVAFSESDEHRSLITADRVFV